VRHFILCIGLLLALTWAQLAQSASAPGGLNIMNLRCEGQIGPIGLDDVRPLLSWECESTVRGARQTAFQILAASSLEALARDEGDRWDSGRVESHQSVNIEYAGSPLRSRERIWWKVRVWDAAGMQSAWSEPEIWEMGLLEEKDWSAKWIDCAPSPSSVRVDKAIYQTLDGKVQADVTDRVATALQLGRSLTASNETLGGDPARDQVKQLIIWYDREGERGERAVREGESVKLAPSRLPLLRRDFQVRGKIAEARLYITALGIYDAWMNGKPVGDCRFPPGWTDYRRRVQYQTYDVTSQLADGDNVIAAEVAPGWYSGRAGLFQIREFYGPNPELLAQLEIEYEDGRVERIVSDETWKRIDGPTLQADMLDGETHDARLEVDDWNVTNAALSDWKAVEVHAAPRRLHAQVDPPVRVVMDLPAREVTNGGNGSWIFDLGQNMVGVAKIRVKEAAGTRIRVRYGEMLNPDGTLYTANLRGAACTDVYICRGNGVEEWEPRFTFHGFRYVELTGVQSAPDKHMVRGRVIATDIPTTGEFESSDERINQLQSNIVWGQRGNYLSVPTDCPQRDERMGWMADAQVFLPTAAYNGDLRRFMRKWMIDVRDAQRDDGAHSDVAPVTRGLSYGTPAWADAGVIVPWTMYQVSGDGRVLHENIESMKRWVDWCEEHSNGLLRDRDRGNDYGDWLAIGEETPKDVIGTAYFAKSAQIVAESLMVLGRTTEADRYRTLSEQVCSAFRNAYIDAQGRVKGDTQCGYVLALRFGIVSGDLKDRAIERLVEKIEGNGWRLSTGFVGVGLLLPVLTESGRADVAARLLVQDEFPSWLFSVKHGATTIWERWDGWTPKTGPHPDIGMNSFNHYSLGSCGEWLYSGVAGIGQRTGTVGFESVEIRPRIRECVAQAGMTEARASYRSVRGKVASAWTVDSGKLTMSVSVPVGAVAQMWIPVEKDGVVMESGLNLEQARPAGVMKVERNGNMLVVEIGSGRYEFETAWESRVSR
jgi:alpha-L-rhamnosidase